MSAAGQRTGVATASPPRLAAARDHRPAVPSPLSSSPVRASSPARASSPLSPVDRNALPQRQTQSSPVQPPPRKWADPAPSRFASRPTRPNPLVRARDDARLARRRDFFRRVRQGADDRAWQRRDIEGQVRGRRPPGLSGLGTLLGLV